MILFKIKTLKKHSDIQMEVPSFTQEKCSYMYMNTGCPWKKETQVFGYITQ